MNALASILSAPDATQEQLNVHKERKADKGSTSWTDSYTARKKVRN